MNGGFERTEFDLDPQHRTVRARLRTAHRTLGWQIFDPETRMFIREGEWMTSSSSGAVEFGISLPPERGRYHVYVSGIDGDSWAYAEGRPFLLIEATVENGAARLDGTSVTTLRRMRRRGLLQNMRKALTDPVRSLWTNRKLIQSMVRRDILARYRGSFGDVFWTVLNPLLLMLTYFFVFGVVLQTRFGATGSRTEFTLYFLAGMLPWLAFSEALGGAPNVIVEHRNFVKKLVFPLEILPVNRVVAGLVTETFALVLFLVALLVLRGGIFSSAAALPLILAPQVMLTLGAAWFVSALGVYFRDLGQVMGFLLTLLFFLTPICYPETQLPSEIAPILTANPIYWLVRSYRAIFLEGALPSQGLLLKLWAAGMLAFFGGCVWFYKLRRSFADVI